MQFIPASADTSFDANPLKWWDEIRRDVADPRPGRRLIVHLKLSDTPTPVGAAREKRDADSKKESATNRLAQKIAETENDMPTVSNKELAAAVPVVSAAAAGDNKSAPTALASSGGGGVLSLTSSQPRYTLTVIDAKGKRAKGPYSCGVLLVPQGREHEWVLNSPAGQAQLAADANFSRLCFVTLNRGHAFTDLDSVKAELAPYMRELAPERNSDGIPYLTVDKQSSSGIGQRTIVAALNTKHNGETVVEDINIPADKVNGAYALRRLVFLSSRLIQSEARIRTGAAPNASLIHAAAAATAAGASARTAKKREKAKQKKAAAAGVLAPAPTPAPTATAAAAPAPAKSDTKSADTKEVVPAASAAAAPGSDVRIDYGWLSCSYYRGMIAALAVASKIDNVLLLGLGGGSMTMFLHEFFPNLTIHGVELDPEVVSLAQTYFGFKPSARLTVEVNDGMVVVQRLHASILAAREKYKGVTVPAAAAPAPVTTTAAAADSKADAAAATDAPKSGGSGGGGGGGGGSSAKDKRKKKKESEAKKEAKGIEAKKQADLVALAAQTPAPEHPEIEKLKRDLIIIDINAQDMSIGLSFPPAPFIAPAFLQMVKACVPSHGAVMWNIGCRNVDLRRQICVDIASAFAEVYELIPDEEDVNRIVIAIPYQRLPVLSLLTVLSRVLKPPASTFVPASASASSQSVDKPGSGGAPAAPATNTAADGSSFDPARHLYSFHPEMNLAKLARSIHILSSERSATAVAEPKLSITSLPSQ